MGIAEVLREAGYKKPKRPTSPVWAGPCDHGPNGGVTFSLLSQFLACRERFRLLVIEGLQPVDALNQRLEFGTMWHACEEALAKKQPWLSPLQNYALALCRKYPLQQEQARHLHEVCRTMFPVYIEHWATHPDVINRIPLLQEYVFDVPYALSSRRKVRLRGKWDSVDVIGGEGIYLQENKSKSEINPVKVRRQLNFDLQTMFYLTALYLSVDVVAAEGLPRGVRYNVVRRSAHRQGKKETAEEFSRRLAELARASPDEWFARWKVKITSSDVAKFRRECLDPILRQLCNWWDWVSGWRRTKGKTNRFDHVAGLHWRHPFGVHNPLDEGGFSDLDECLASGSELGLQHTDRLFKELDPCQE